MSVFLPLLLTHFLADYPFQWGGLIRLKQKNFGGVFLHCLIHLTVMLMVMHAFLYDWRTLWGVLIVFGTHNIIDQIKVTLDKKNPTWRLPLYLIDQLAHFIIVLGVAWWLSDLTPAGPLAPFYENKLFVLYLITLVLGTYFYDVTRYFVKHPKPDKISYKRDWHGILMHTAGITIVFGGIFVGKALLA